MEFDNDRIVKRAYKIELFYLALLILINPLVNSITFFLVDFRIWPVLLLVNLALFPAYVLYSRFIVAKFLFQKKYVWFIPATITFFCLVLMLILGGYSIILNFPLSEKEKNYFFVSYPAIIRESVWITVNMALATAVSFIKEALDEKDMLSVLQKDNTFYKLRYLRAQLNPHFLFNTLNSIYSLSLQKSEKAPEVVVRLADIMRYLIYECNEEKIPLNKEIDFIRNYIEIEKLRYSADIRFTIEGETGDIMIEPFLFISFIENGFKHALNNSFKEPFIYITLKVAAGRIVLNVINSSSADLEAQAKRINGKGITSSKSLLELLYPDSYDLDIIQTEKEESRENSLCMHNAKERLEELYPDSHTLDVILKNNTFAVSLIIKPRAA
ncbi:MAG: sensor histidine kinase [Chitinophagaceae bacterium]|nr:sensor histidine kinase [Chitinophagaceae bacterium]